MSSVWTPGTGITPIPTANFILPGQNVTLNVPSVFASINAAMTFIAGWVILGTVTIKVADGTYTLTSGILTNHPFGPNISIIGNQSNPQNCILYIAGQPTFDLFVASNGNQLGLVDGFTSQARDRADLAHNYTSFLAVNGAQMKVGPNCHAYNWYYGIAARNGSFIECSGAQVTGAGDVGIWAFVGSTVNAQGCTVVDVADNTNNFGWGYEAEYGSVVDCSGSSATTCLRGGIGSLTNSNVRALGATTNGNIGSGFWAQDGATIECHNSAANSNGRWGVEEVGSSRIIGNNLTLLGNTLGAVKPTAILDNSSNGARLTTNVATPLRLDAVGANPIFHNTGGGLQLEIRDMPGAVNRVYAQGGGPATSNQVVVGADGSDTNVPIRYQSKGTGDHFFRTGGGLQFDIFDTPAAVNWLQTTGGVAGNDPRIQAAGSDTNINVRLTGKGTGTQILTGLVDYADDTAAAAGGIIIGQTYKTGSVVKIRVT